MEQIDTISTKLRVKELLKEKRWTTKVLAEKTGLSESYLTHIKNGTRRWNEDSLKKLAAAFDLSPIDIFDDRKTKMLNDEANAVIPHDVLADLNIKIVPVVGEIPTTPSEYNNKLIQITTGFKNVFVPVTGNDDNSMFCLCVDNDSYSPTFEKGDLLVISPEAWTRSGDVVAIEYEQNGKLTISISQITYREDFIILESVNHKNPPVTLIRSKNKFRIIGKVVSRFQKFM
jgi:phage repressor protein C with HTH and peptisase S24 domain